MFPAKLPPNSEIGWQHFSTAARGRVDRLGACAPLAPALRQYVGNGTRILGERPADTKRVRLDAQLAGALAASSSNETCLKTIGYWQAYGRRAGVRTGSFRRRRRGRGTRFVRPRRRRGESRTVGGVFGPRPRRLYAGLSGFLRTNIERQPLVLVDDPGPDDVVVLVAAWIFRRRVAATPRLRRGYFVETGARLRYMFASAAGIRIESIRTTSRRIGYTRGTTTSATSSSTSTSETAQ